MSSSSACAAIGKATLPSFFAFSLALSTTSVQFIIADNVSPPRPSANSVKPAARGAVHRGMVRPAPPSDQRLDGSARGRQGRVRPTLPVDARRDGRAMLDELAGRQAARRKCRPAPTYRASSDVGLSKPLEGFDTCRFQSLSTCPRSRSRSGAWRSSQAQVVDAHGALTRRRRSFWRATRAPTRSALSRAGMA